jgi:hypothetical protein
LAGSNSRKRNDAFYKNFNTAGFGILEFQVAPKKPEHDSNSKLVRGYIDERQKVSSGI